MKKNFFLSEQALQILTILGIGVVIILFIINVNFLRGNLVTTFDDSYMFIRYARNLLDGHGIAWNPDGVQTYGVTSLVYMFLIAGGMALFPSAGYGPILSISATVLGLGFVAILALGTFWLAESDFLKKNRLLFPTFLSILLLSSMVFRLHGVSGMDTNLSVLCNALLIFAAIGWVKRPDYGSLTLLVITAYICFLTRPDALLYAILFPLVYGWFYFREGRVKQLAIFCMAMAVVLLADTLLKLWIFGDPLPLPFYSKKAGFYDGYRAEGEWNPIPYLFLFFTMMYPFIAVLIFSASSKNWRLIVAFFFPVLLTFLYLFSFTQIMGFWARYYYPALPFFVMGSFLVLDHRLRIPESVSFLSWRALLTTIGLLFLLLPSVQSRLKESYEARFIGPLQAYKSEISRKLDNDYPKLGWRVSIKAMAELSAALPEGTRVAMSEYGYPGAMAPHVYIIDMVGLHDPYFAHNGFSSAELFRRQPDMIWFPVPAYSKMVASIQDDPTLFEEYIYYPYAFDNGVAVRRDSEHYDIIMKLLMQTWQKYSPEADLEPFIP